MMLSNCGTLQKTLESPLDCKEIQPVNPKGNRSWIFIGRIDVEAEIPILWPPEGKNWLIWKDPDAGKDWGQEEKGTTEDEMVGWHHQLNGHGFGWTPGVGDGQGGLACWGSWGRKESDTTERLNWTGIMTVGLPWWLRGKESAHHCRRCVFDPWVGKIPLEKEMATHSSILAWEIPWTEEPGGLHSMGSQKRHDLVTKQYYDCNFALSLVIIYITSIFLPREEASWSQKPGLFWLITISRFYLTVPGM